jgi:hypothetical protein
MRFKCEMGENKLNWFLSPGHKYANLFSALAVCSTMIMQKKRVISCNEIAPDIHIIYIDFNSLLIAKMKY